LRRRRKRPAYHGLMAKGVERKEAKSRTVDYSPPIEIHETGRKRIEFVPFYVGRSLAFKIIAHDKSAQPWRSVAISFNDQDALKLREQLGIHLAVAQEEGQGSYLVTKTDGSVDVGDLDVEQIATAVSQLLEDRELAQHLDRLELGGEIVGALRVELRLRELRSAVAELANHLREGEAREQVYQDWCERHSWAFGNAYVVSDELRNISAGDQIDLLLPRLLGGFRDLIELKRPDMKVLNRDDAHASHYWTAEVSKAVGQCHRYLDVLHEEVGDGRLRGAPEVVAYHPRATIVIGRSNQWTQDEHKALHGLNRRLADISVITYDHLLAQARQALAVVDGADRDLAESGAPAETEPSDWDFGPDEAPF